MSPRRLGMCLSVPEPPGPGWAGQAGGWGGSLFLELLSPPYGLTW